MPEPTPPLRARRSRRLRSLPSLCGWPGVGAAIAGILLAPLAVVLLLTLAVQPLQGWSVVAGALRGMGVVAAGLVVATAVKLAGELRASALGMPWCALFTALTLVAMGSLRWPLIWGVPGLGLVASAMAWRRLRQ